MPSILWAIEPTQQKVLISPQSAVSVEECLKRLTLVNRGWSAAAKLGKPVGQNRPELVDGGSNRWRSCVFKWRGKLSIWQQETEVGVELNVNWEEMANGEEERTNAAKLIGCLPTSAVATNFSSRCTSPLFQSMNCCPPPSYSTTLVILQSNIFNRLSYFHKLAYAHSNIYLWGPKVIRTWSSP